MPNTNDNQEPEPISSKPSSETQTDNDDVKTAGGRKGNFSDTDREDESQWSPGSTQSSDQ